MPKPDWHPQWKLYRVISGHSGWVTSVCVEPGNQWFATGAGVEHVAYTQRCAILVFHARLACLLACPHASFHIVLTSDMLACSGSKDRTIKIWDLASCQLKLTLTGHISAVKGMEVSNRHPYLFSVGEDKTVKCWDLEQNKVIRHYHGHLRYVCNQSASLQPVPDGNPPGSWCVCSVQRGQLSLCAPYPGPHIHRRPRRHCPRKLPWLLGGVRCLLSGLPACRRPGVPGNYTPLHFAPRGAGNGYIQHALWLRAALCFCSFVVSAAWVPWAGKRAQVQAVVKCQTVLRNPFKHSSSLLWSLILTSSPPPRCGTCAPRPKPTVSPATPTPSPLPSPRRSTPKSSQVQPQPHDQPHTLDAPSLGID